MSSILFAKKDIDIFKNWNNISSADLECLKKKIIRYFKFILNIRFDNILLYVKNNNDVNISTLTFFDKLNYNIDFDYRYKINICTLTCDIINIIKKTPVIIKDYDDICELESLPIILNDIYEVHVKDLCPVLLNKKTNTYTKLSFQFLFLENNKLVPLFYENEEMFLKENDNHLRVPYYDKNNKYAVILNRYENGLNIMYVYIDVKDNIIYTCDLFNFTNPRGLAIEMINEKMAKIFLSFNHDIKYIYKNYNFTNKNKDKISFWANLNIKREFHDVYGCIKFIKKYQDPNIFEKYYDFVETANMYLNNNEFENALNIYNKLVDYPKLYKNYLFLDINIRDIYYIYYNIYLCYLELKNENQAVYYFKKFTECFDDLNIIDKNRIIDIIENKINNKLEFLKDSKHIHILKEVYDITNIIKIKMLI
jgi:hypothetical protein